VANYTSWTSCLHPEFLDFWLTTSPPKICHRILGLSGSLGLWVSSLQLSNLPSYPAHPRSLNGHWPQKILRIPEMNVRNFALAKQTSQPRGNCIFGSPKPGNSWPRSDEKWVVSGKWAMGNGRWQLSGS